MKTIAYLVHFNTDRNLIMDYIRLKLKEAEINAVGDFIKKRILTCYTEIHFLTISEVGGVKDGVRYDQVFADSGCRNTAYYHQLKARCTEVEFPFGIIEYVKQITDEGEAETRAREAYASACGAYDRAILRSEFRHYVDTDVASLYPKLFVAARGNGKTSMQLQMYKRLLFGDKIEIEKVIFNDPATIVFWADGSKTVVKAENEPFDPEKGLAMAISKKVLGNKGNYFNEFKKWLPKKEEPLDILRDVGTTAEKATKAVRRLAKVIKKVEGQ